jgi:acyl carrier protein
MVTAADIRTLLARRDLPVPAADTDPLNLDSLSLAWLVHSLDVELNVQLEPMSDDDTSFSSIAVIVEYVNRTACR